MDGFLAQYRGDPGLPAIWLVDPALDLIPATIVFCFQWKDLVVFPTPRPFPKKIPVA
jgi:hypothetical protein